MKWQDDISSFINEIFFFKFGITKDKDSDLNQLLQSCRLEVIVEWQDDNSSCINEIFIF